jgi:hypothetical protein
MLEVAEADLELGFLHVKAPQTYSKSLAERVDANDRAFRVSRWRTGSHRSAPSSPWRGTEGSNPSLSSGEMVWGRRRGDGTIVAASN